MGSVEERDRRWSLVRTGPEHAYQMAVRRQQGFGRRHRVGRIPPVVDGTARNLLVVEDSARRDGCLSCWRAARDLFRTKARVRATEALEGGETEGGSTRIG